MNRTSFVLISVLAVLGSSLLIAMSLLMLAQAHTASMSGGAERARSRALAWSGLQVVMAELDGQRDRILEGRLPRMDGQYEIYDAGDRLGVVRLLPTGPGSELLVAESARIDLNLATAESLAATGLIDDALAEAVVDARGDGYQSVAALLAVPGMTPELLYGPLEDITPGEGLDGETPEIAERVLDRLSGADPRGLADAVTVYAAEPALQRDGRRRINLDVEWSDELAAAVDDRFGEGASGILRGIFSSGVRFTDETVIYRVLNTVDTPLDDWPDIVDSLTTQSELRLFGRININAAPRETLMSLPGIDDALADRIVETRAGLPVEDLATVVWPAREDILDRSAYEELGDRITCRSWTYRLRVAAGEVDADAPDGAVFDPVVHEVVIDLTDPAPRIAYLRDITFLDTAVALAGRVEPAEVSEAPREPGDLAAPAGDPLEDPLPAELEEADWSLVGDEPAEEADWSMFADDPEPAAERSEPEPPPSGDTAGSSAPGGRRIGRWIPG